MANQENINKNNHMLPINSSNTDLKFSHEDIVRQLDKMLADPVFVHSGILRNFLSFIVAETLAGRSNSLKEYTIALNVLGKPKTFRAKDDCIVRIHAVRLRKTLMSYYNGAGAEDLIRISLPKGSYVPHFADNLDIVLNSILSQQPALHEGPCIDGHCATAAVIPFHCLDRRKIIKDLSEGLGLQLCSALKKIRSLSVISYNISRRIPDKFADLNGISHLFHAQYLFTGDVQSLRNSIRINVEMIRAETCEQVWSETFDRRITGSNSFRIQDEIIGAAMKSMQRQIKILSEKRNGASIMSVA